MSEAVKLGDVHVIQELYPRKRHQDRIVAQYRQSIDLLPPIDVAKHDGKLVLVDGYHRLLAHRLEGLEIIPVNIVDTDDVLVEAIRRNAAHGFQLEDGDKAACARLLYQRDDHPLKDEVELCLVLGVTSRAVRGYLSDIKRKEKDERNALIQEMWFDCYSQEEIADVAEVDVKTIQREVDKMEELPKCPDAPSSLQSWTVFDEWRDCDESYGCNYPGRMPGQVIENLLYFLTKTGECVLDPMAGSGTTRDVCQTMGRRCFTSDANPFPGKDFIRKHAIPPDGFLPATSGTISRAGGFKLVVLDPPYWKQAEYGNGDEIIGAKETFDGYVTRVGAIITNALALVKGNGGYVAVIASSTMDKGQVYDPVPLWQADAVRAGARVWDHIIVPYTSQRAMPFDVTSARDNKRLLRRYRDLIVLQG
jgi:hypothetical protein